MKAKKYICTVLAFFTLIFAVSGSFSAKAAESSYSYTNDYVYGMLETKAERQFYNDLTASCEAVHNSYDFCSSIGRVYFPFSLTEERVVELMIIFMNNAPKYFWLGSTYRINSYFHAAGSVTIDVMDYFKDGDVRQSTRAKIEAAEREYIDEALKYDTQYERAVALHDKILENVEYESGEWDQSIASVFLQKATVCAGYSKAYALLCHAVGIDIVTVTSVNHAWNIINISGNWFVVDVTNNYNSKKYFFISDSMISTIDKYNSAAYRHEIDVSEYPYYHDKFPKCPYSYSEIADRIPGADKLFGDANLDGVVNVRDAAYIAVCLSQGVTLPELADYNRDGKINVRDAAALANCLAAA